MYTDAIDTSKNSLGTLQDQNEIFLESSEAHIQQMRTSFEDLYDSIFKAEDFNGVYDFIAGLADGTAKWFDSIGGGSNVLLELGSIATSVLSRQIAGGIATTITNFQNAKNNAQQFRAELEILQDFKGINGLDDSTQELIEMKKSILDLGDGLTVEQQNIGNSFIKTQNAIYEERDAWEDSKKTAQDYLVTLGEYNDLSEITQKDKDSMNALLEEEIKVNEGHAKAIDKAKQALAGYNLANTENVRNSKESSDSNKRVQESMQALDQSMTTVIERINQLKDADRLSVEQQDKLTNAINKYNEAVANKGNVGQASQDLLNTFNSINNGLIDSAKKTMKTIEVEFQGRTYNISKSLADNSEEFEKWKKSMKLQNQIQGFVQLASAIGQVGSIMQSIKSLGRIWNDEDLEWGEKMTQTLMNLGTLIPMVTTLAKTLSSSIKTLAISFGAVSAETATFRTAISGLWSAIPTTAKVILGVVAAIGGAVAAFKSLTVSAKEAKENLEKSFSEYDKTNDELKELEDKLAEVNERLKELYSYNKSELTITNKEEINKLEAENTALQTQIDLKKEALALENSKIARDASVAAKTDAYEKGSIYETPLSDLDLSNSFGIKLNNEEEYRNASIVEWKDPDFQKRYASDIEKFTNTLEKAINLENGSSNEDSENNETKKEEEEREKLAFQAELLRAYLKSDDGKQIYENYSKGFMLESDFFEALKYEMPNILKMYDEGKLEITVPDGSLISNPVDLDTSIGRASEYIGTNSVQTIPEDVRQNNLEQDTNLITSLREKENFGLEDISGLTLEQIEKSLTDYQDAMKSLSALREQEILDPEAIAYYEDIVKDYYVLAGKFDKTVQNVFSQVIPSEDILNNLKDNMEDLLVDEEFNKVDEDLLEDILGEENYNNLLDWVNSLGLSIYDLLEGLSQTEISFKELQETAKEIEVPTYEYKADKTIEEIETDRKEFEDERAKDTTINAAIDSIAEKGDLSGLDEESLAHFVSLMEEIPGLNKESASAAQEWSYIQNTGTQEQIEYLTHLQALRNSYYKDAIISEKELLEAERERKEEIADEYETRRSDLAYVKHYDTEGKTSEEISKYEQDKLEYEAVLSALVQINDEIVDLDNQINNTDWELKIDLAGVEELLDLGENIITEAEQISKATSLIGEGFLVAADDAQELAKIYPALYENAEVLADGQVQLSEDTVKELLGDESVLLSSDTEAAINKIDSQIAILEAKKAESEAELKLAQAVAKGEVDLEGQKTEILANGREKLTNYLMRLGVSEVNADKAAKAAMAGNLEEYNNLTAGVSDDIANNLAGALASAATSAKNNAENMVSSLASVATQANLADKAIRNIGKGGGTDEKVIVEGGAATGEGFSATKRDYSFEGVDFEELSVEKPEVAKWIEQLNLDISGYTQGIAELEALKARLRKNQQDTQGLIDNVGLPKDEDGKGGGGSGSGGGDSGGKEEQKEENAEIIDQLEDETDIYHDIDLIIKELTKDLSRLQDQQKKLSGKELIKNLNKQLEILEKQKEAYKEKLEIAKMEAGALKSVLAGQGATFDSDGLIANYYSLMDAKLKQVNDVIAKYNNMSAEEQEAYKEVVEKAKEEYENFKSIIEQYDKLIADTIPSIEDQFQEALDKEIEIQIQKFTMEVDLRLNMADAERDFNEFKRKVIDGIKEEDILGNAKSKLLDFSSYYKGKGKGTVEVLTKQINETMEQINQINKGGTSTVYGDDKAKAMEDLKKYYEELMDQLESVEELVNEINQSYLDMIDEAKEKFDGQISQYKYISELINHNMNLIGLLHGDDAYGQLSKYYEAQEKNNNKQLDFYKQQAELWKQRMDSEEEGSEAWKKYKENWEEAVSGLNSTVENSVQNLIDKYKNTVNKIFDDLNNKFTDNKGLDYINEEWQLINKNADAYLDTVNSMFEIQKLENKYLEAIDNTDSLSAQQKLNDLMNEQLDMLRDKEKITQYDVDRANALYEIALKEIALQDAQQNKSKMRLRRDSQGNYSYQYVSDQDSIAQAQQELAEAQNSLYNMDKEQYKNNLNEIYGIYSEFQQKLLELYQDQTLSDEEREEKKKLLVEQYGELINGLVEQNESIRQNLQESTFQELANLYNVNVSNFLEMSEAEKEILMNSMIPQWDSGIQQMTDKFAGEDGFVSSCEEAFQKLDEATKEYLDSLSDLEANAGINFDTIADGYDKNIQLSQDLLEANDALISKYNEQISAVQSVIAQVNELISKYTQAKNEAIAATEAAYKFWQQENAKAAEQAKREEESKKPENSTNPVPEKGKEENGKKPENSTDPVGEKDEDKKPGSGGGKKDGIPQVGDIVTYTGGLYYYDSQGTAPTGSRGKGKKVKITYINEGAPYPIHVESNDSAYGWLKKDQIEGYETGGYTGSWNNSKGKLAVLHEKELVLNKEDTSNILSAVDMVRNLDSVFQSLNDSLLNRLSNLVSNLNNNFGNINTGEEKILEQKVQIDATFPNVKDSREIEDAFNNLINYASQYAYSTRK